jgi:hypothetical protein
MLVLSSCNHASQSQKEQEQMTASQEKMLADGWQLTGRKGGELNNTFGINAQYGIQDNYFDIAIGQGCSVAIKIMNASTNRCIRYVYVPENETVTVTEIPQGVYYLKLAYGQDWMELPTDSITHGKFSKNVFYERSTNTYDFGKKNSLQEVNYDLRINVCEEAGINNFETSPISEEEFLK